MKKVTILGKEFAVDYFPVGVLEEVVPTIMEVGRTTPADGAHYKGINSVVGKMLVANNHCTAEDFYQMRIPLKELYMAFRTACVLAGMEEEEAKPEEGAGPLPVADTAPKSL